MGLETPRLDDRSFEDLVEEARRRIPLYTPEWTDHNLSDPGITLLELMAWMSDIILYRLNRVPDKHFVKFMELIGM
jgi:predicted phage baseplate assembly protein